MGGSLLFFVFLLAVALASWGCNNNQSDQPPVAVASVIGAGFQNSTRSGSLIVLSAKDSDGFDSPILEFEWSASDPAVVLEERSANSVAFRAPSVDSSTPFDFMLRVRDASGQTATTIATVIVEPVGDIDKFLAAGDGADVGAFVSGAVDLGRFTLHVMPTGVPALNETFSVTIRVYARYPDRDAACADFIPGTTQCRSWVPNVLLELDGLAYPNGLDFPIRFQDVPFASGSATSLDVAIPNVNVSLINQFVLDSLPGKPTLSDRRALIDPWKADSVEMVLAFELQSVTSASLRFSGPGRTGLAQSTLVGNGVLPNSVTATEVLEDVLEDGVTTLPIETRSSAVAYYDAIDPMGQMQTLSDWLALRGFTGPNGAGQIGLLDEARIGAGEFAHSKYLNNFDLGFGRDMFTRVDPSSGNVYSFVTNYPTLQATLEGRDEVLTVVMEFSPPGAPGTNDALGAPKFTKFFVFVPDEETGEEIRVGSIDFDGRGNRFVPGVCIACHSGSVAALDDYAGGAPYPAQGDIAAAFMPWDLESFLYSDTDPAIPKTRITPDSTTLDDLDPLRVYTRNAQQEQFRRHNSAALATYLQANPATTRFDPVLDLVRLWYASSPPFSTSTICNDSDCLTSNFDASAIPVAWNGSPLDRQLYLEVHAQHCRACHTLLPDTLRLETPSEFLTNPKLTDMVFRTGVMPLARLTMDRLWLGTDRVDDPIAVLQDRLGGGLPIPGSPIVVAEAIVDQVVDATDPNNTFFRVAPITGGVMTKVGRDVALQVTTLLFSESVSWTFNDMAPGCSSDLPGTLVDDGQGRATFRPSAAGNYCLQAIAVGSGPSTSSDPILVSVVDNRPPTIVTSTCMLSEPCTQVNEGGMAAIGATQPLFARFGPAMFDNFFASIIDPDVTDGLDPAAALEIQFNAAFPSALGSILSPGNPGGRISYDHFLSGQVLYQTDMDEIGPIDLFDDLSFTLFDSGSSIGTISATVQVRAVNSNVPVFDALMAFDQTIQVTFAGGPTSSTVSFCDAATDADGQTVTVVLDSGSNGFGSNVLTATPCVPAKPGTQFTIGYSANTAAASPVSCAVGAIPSDAFTFAACDADLTCGPSAAGNRTASRRLSIELVPSNEFLSYVDLDGVSRAGVRSRLRAAPAPGPSTCGGCHQAANAIGFLSDSTLAIPSSLVDLNNPMLSRLITRAEAPGHVGGQASGPAWDAVKVDLVRWIQECAP